MKYENLMVEKKECDFLKKMLSNANYHDDNTYKAAAKKLSQELKEANIVSSQKLPKDVVCLNAMVTIKTPFAVKKTYQLVTPENSDLKNNKISILTPMGLALFGYAEGDHISWLFPMGESSIELLKVEQRDTVLSNL